MIVVLFVVSLLADWYIFRDIRRYAAPKGRKAWSIIYAVLSALFWVFLIVVICMPRRDVNASILPVMWMLYAYVTIYAAKFIYVICSFIGKLFRPRRNYGVAVGVVLALITFAGMWYGALVTRYKIEVTQAVVESEKLPDKFDNFKIVQFSDVHVGTWGNDTTFISTLVDSINAQKPDLILFTGDTVNRVTSELDPFVAPLSRLKAPYGVYSILGNHDYGDYADWDSPADRDANNARLAELQRQMGWTLLNNDYDFIRVDGDSIALIGVENWGEPPFPTYGDLRKAYRDSALGHHLNDEKFKILMTHNPEHWRREVTQLSNIDLSLAGHTHAMQAMVKLGGFKWSPSAFKYKNWGGLYGEESGKPMNLYVNIGDGEVGFPARLGAAYPEVTVLTLKKKK